MRTMTMAQLIITDHTEEVQVGMESIVMPLLQVWIVDIPGIVLTIQSVMILL